MPTLDQELNTKSINKSSLFSSRLSQSDQLQKRITYLVMIGINLEFFRDFLNKFQYSVGGLEGSGGTQIIASLMLILAAALAWRQGRAKHILPIYQKWLVVITLYSLILLFRSALIISLEQASILLTLLEWLPFVLFSLMLIGCDFEIWRYLNKVFIVHTLIGIVTVFSGVLELTALDRFAFEESGAAAGMWALYAAPFLFLTWNQQSRWGKLAALLGMIAYFSVGLFTLTRTFVLNRGLIWMVLYVIIWWRIKGQSYHFKHKATLKPLFLLIYVILLILLLNQLTINLLGKSNILTTYQTAFIERLITESSISEESRVQEAYIVMSQMTQNDWAVGRGINSYWIGTDLYGGDLRSVVHIGYLHLIFKGGIPLLLLYLTGPLALGLWGLFTFRNPLQLAASGILVQYVFELITLGVPEAKLWYILICLCMGLAVLDPKRLKYESALVRSNSPA